MKMTIESTTRLVEVSHRNGEFTTQCRIWEGQTEKGVTVQCLMLRVATGELDKLEEFARDLREQVEPKAQSQAFPLKMVL